MSEREKPISAENAEVVITRLGAQGDGVAHVGDTTQHVAYALPGESVRIALRDGGRADLVEICRSSPDRITPVCRHFGVCGGCKLQHFAPLKLAEWQRDHVRAAFAARGLDPDIASVRTFPDARRRRVVLAFQRTEHGPALGFHAARDPAVVSLEDCPVASERIVSALPGLARLAAYVAPPTDPLRLTVLEADNGLDIMVEGIAGKIAPQALAAAAKLAPSLTMIRLSAGREPLLQLAAPIVRFGSALVTPPPGVFVQALAEAEATMTSLILGAFSRKTRRVADLFCGLGAFTFPLAARAEVLAVDGDVGALAALEVAARKTPGLKKIATRRRDLFREPLSPMELKDFDLAVLDPPRAGARAQAEALARSRVPTVVFVSCDMGTLARDARLLADGGYRLGTVTPIDQFRYSAHIEAVAVFRR